ncbi:hypothetical protein [Bacillus amyloliquefaciens]|uniref:hypothetical protein n=1 Tax=Bacillus amyloliquefaciens TaxID=1390 RepID=UPI00293E3187|nr:hypothetical protein [Bacillus amyloliquefaciens]WOH97333.1 hypothetical protein R0744_19595 [Bacillus amyloliquefaciens]
MIKIASKFSPATILAELDKFTTSFMEKADEIASKFSPATILAELLGSYKQNVPCLV